MSSFFFLRSQTLISLPPIRSASPKAQAVKREMLDKAGIDSSRVTFVAADFETEDWLARLVEAGFNPGEPALFLWEGVMVYLDREAVEDTLRKVAGTAKGSVLAFDYFTTEPLESQALYWRYGRAGNCPSYRDGPSAFRVLRNAKESKCLGITRFLFRVGSGCCLSRRMQRLIVI